MMNTIFEGRLERWNDGKGFGFIHPDDGRSDVFIHISALKHMVRRPIIGDIIYYQLSVGDDGKCKAINARIKGVGFREMRETSVSKQAININQFITVLFLLLVVVIAGYFLYSKFVPYHHNEPGFSADLVASGISNHDLILQDAFQSRASNIQVEGSGMVSKLLPDDTDGSRHQRFIVRLNSAQTLLISHNTDLASRIDDIKEGDVINFYGEYEWNEKGGVVHWTHHDPNGDHVAGWLKHNGKMYQ
jgi:cold shock CspA family protein